MKTIPADPLTDSRFQDVLRLLQTLTKSTFFWQSNVSVY